MYFDPTNYTRVKITLLLLLSLVSLLCSADNIQGIINQYSKVFSLGDCRNKIVVKEAEKFNKNEDVLIIQMKGVEINEENGLNYGAITNIHSAGYFEVAKINDIANDTITFYFDLLNTYDFEGAVQIVSYPNYSSAIVTEEILTCKEWDGEIGGVLAFNCDQGVFVYENIDVSGKGFRGGAKKEGTGNACSWLLTSPNAYYPTDSWEGAEKGEGFANKTINQENGRGPQGSGGGGGNDHNSGGAGGGNFGNGGNGGNNDDPGFFNCSGYYPGLGGIDYDYNEERAFLGGGGGAGHGNNNLSSAGGNGGGIVFIEARYIVGDTLHIIARGDDALTTSGGDGAGGGGAGGTVLLNLEQLNSQITIDVSGGKGGDVNDENTARCHGPGGGGAGGYVNASLNTDLITVIASGGSPGIVTNSTAACNGSSNNAGQGENGAFATTLTIPKSTVEGNCGITALESLNKIDIKIFPTFSQTGFKIQRFSEDLHISVLDGSGKTIKILNREDHFGEDLANGVYFVRTESGSRVNMIRIIKMN